MGLFTHVRSKSAKRYSKNVIRPIYRALLFASLAIYAMWAVIHYDPSSAVKSRIGHASHPQHAKNVNTRRGRRLAGDADVFSTAESEVQCELDNECEALATETACFNNSHCEWYTVLSTCEHSTSFCSEETNKTRCDTWCPQYNWTLYDLNNGNSTSDFSGAFEWSAAEDLCNETGYECNCTGVELVEVHNECEHEIFGVPINLRTQPLHSIWILLIVIYGFIGIAIVCDTYFEPSLETISEKLKLTPDVAGATFMAMGSSAPELFTSLSDNFITQNNVGVGTIVGSALFNILIIVALSAFVARPRKGEPDLKGGIVVDWRPVLRDVIFYSVSVGLLIGFIIDESVYWWEALIMILAYVVYIIYMTQNPKIIACCDRAAAKKKESAVAPLSATVEMTGPRSEAARASPTPVTTINSSNSKSADPGQAKPVDVESGESKEGDAKPSKDSGDEAAGKAKEEGDDDDDDDDDDDWRVWPTKEEWAEKGCGSKFWFILVAPLNVMFWLTIPNCANPNPCLQSLYPLTFVNCVLWMAVLCAFETILVTWIGCWWGISAPVMGIVILAIGTSVPDAIASMIVARAGQGDMAIANAVGSNVFDVLFGLGLPWLIADLVFQNKNNCQELVGIFVDVDGIVGAALLLYGTVVFYFCALLIGKWKLNKVIAAVLALMYLFVITLLMVNEYCVNGFTWKAYNSNCPA